MRTQEDDDEEESQIESSMPLYLDHVFGASVGMSPVLVSSFGRISPSKNQQLLSQGKHQVFSIPESQGFSILGEFGIARGDTQVCTSALNLADVHELLEKDISVAARQQSSSNAQLFFHSPEDVRESCKAVFLSNVDQCCSKTLKHDDTSCQILSSVRKAGVGKKRKHQSRSREDQDYVHPPGCATLRDCAKADKIVDVLALVLQVNSPMDVMCKRGLMAGQTVMMSSVLLADPTKSYFKLSLWREAASWAERISIGDIVYLKHIKLKLWSNEVVGTTVRRSSILNLHQPNKKLPLKVQQSVPQCSVTGLMQWGKKSLGYLFQSHIVPKSQREVGYCVSQELTANSLIHFQAKLLCLVSPRVVLMADHPGITVHIHLIHPAAPLWHSELSGGVGQVWECLYLAVVGEETSTQSGSYTLQTTSCTRFRMLSATSPQALEIMQKFPTGGLCEDWMVSCDSITDMLSVECSGTYKVRGMAHRLEFILEDDSKLHLASTESATMLCRAIYVGCEACSRPLSQVFCQTMVAGCLMIMASTASAYLASESHLEEKPRSLAGSVLNTARMLLKDLEQRIPNTRSVSVAGNSRICETIYDVKKLTESLAEIRMFFSRPLLVTLCDSADSVLTTCVTVSASHLVVPKVLGFSGKAVVQASLSKSHLDQGLWAWKKEAAVWIIRCSLAKDENSFIQEMSFSLLDTHPI